MRQSRSHAPERSESRRPASRPIGMRSRSCSGVSRPQPRRRAPDLSTCRRFRSWRFPFGERSLNRPVPPSFAEPTEAGDWLVNGAGYRAALAHDCAAPDACNERVAPQFAVSHDIEPLARLNQRPIAMLGKPAPFLAAFRRASGIAFGNPLFPKALRASAYKVNHRQSLVFRAGTSGSGSRASVCVNRISMN